MTASKRIVPTLLTAVAVVLYTTSAALADPVRIVTWGSVDSHEGDSTFSLMGSGFSISGEIPGIDYVRGRCMPCTPGTPIDLAASAAPHFSADSAEVDGTRYEGISLYGGPYISGNLSFAGGPIVAPALPTGGFAERWAPFTFGGVLNGFDNSTLSGPPLFTLNLRGSGMARLEFDNSVEFGLRAGRITYEFQQAAPVPEPATMLLLGSGLAGVVLARRRRRLES